MVEYIQSGCRATESGCWDWLRYRNQDGYGIGTYGRREGAHRLSYRAFVRDIPQGTEIHHLCGNRACVNPAHLTAIPHAENLKRDAARKTHCPKGHAYDESNTIVTIRGRSCRICRRNAGRRASANKRLGRLAAGGIDLDVFCKNGHLRTAEDTYLWQGLRRCRICRLEQKRKPDGYIAKRLARAKSGCR